MKLGTSLVVQWLRLHAANAEDACLIPGWGSCMLHSVVKNLKKLKINEVGLPWWRSG